MRKYVHNRKYVIVLTIIILSVVFITSLIFRKSVLFDKIDLEGQKAAVGTDATTTPPFIIITHPLPLDKWMQNTTHNITWISNFKKGTNNTGLFMWNGLKVIEPYGIGVNPYYKGTDPLNDEGALIVREYLDMIPYVGTYVSIVVDVLDWTGAFQEDPEGITARLSIVPFDRLTNTEGLPVKIPTRLIEQAQGQFNTGNLAIGTYKIKIEAILRNGKVATSSGVFSIIKNEKPIISSIMIGTTTSSEDTLDLVVNGSGFHSNVFKIGIVTDNLSRLSALLAYKINMIGGIYGESSRDGKRIMAQIPLSDAKYLLGATFSVNDAYNLSNSHFLESWNVEQVKTPTKVASLFPSSTLVTTCNTVTIPAQSRSSAVYTAISLLSKGINVCEQAAGCRVRVVKVDNDKYDSFILTQNASTKKWTAISKKTSKLGINGNSKSELINGSGIVGAQESYDDSTVENSSSSISFKAASSYSGAWRVHLCPVIQ